MVDDFATLEQRRSALGQTLGFLRPARLVGLEIVPVRHSEWTEDDKAKLFQDGLFDSKEVRSRPPLRKLSHDFYYHYECATPAGPASYRHKVTDWEAGALYWNCVHDHGKRWEEQFRQKMEREFAEKDLHFLMGTVHRFPDQWLIVGLAYPPNQPPADQQAQQLALGWGGDE